jgi:hypothetical protein
VDIAAAAGNAMQTAMWLVETGRSEEVARGWLARTLERLFG